MNPPGTQTSPKLAPSVERYADDQSIRRLGYLLVVVVFGCFGAWAAFAPLGSAALAIGTITVEGYRKTVQHLEGGIVKAIHVRDGDSVDKGQVVLELDDTQARAQLETLRGQLFAALAKEARLVAERDGKHRVAYPQALADAADPRAQEAMRGQEQAFSVRKRSREGQIGILQEQRRELGARIDGLKAQKASRHQLADSLRQDLADFRALLKEGYMERQKVTELERRLTQAEGDIGDFAASIATAQTQISETALKILQIEKELQREVADDLSQVQTELTGLREKTQWLTDTVARTVIRAPESGMVLGLAVHTLGAVVPPGGRLLDIVPQQQKLVVEAQVSPMDIDRVRVGQSTEVRLTAFKSALTPKTEGRLVTVSADRITDEQNQVSYYLARVEVDAEGLRQLKERGLVLLPGMPAEVLINTGDRTLFEYLLQPLDDMFARALIED